MKTKLVISAGVAAIALATLAPTAGALAQSDAPIRLSIDAPGGDILSEKAKIKKKRNRKGKKKKRLIDRRPNFPEESILFEDGYDLYFRLEAPDAEALHKWRRENNNFGPNYDVLVLSDADECLDLSHTVPADLFPAFGTPPSLEDCNPSGDPTYQPDETFINFHIDPYDAPRVRDSSGGYCRETVLDGLVDDEFGSETPLNSNKVYVDPRFSDPSAGIGAIFPVGPNTGGFVGFDPFDLSYQDCYGFGTDDDLPGLVVMANVGASRVFDENLNFTDGRIRNMAGFLSGVGFELIDNSDSSAIVARMPVTRNMLRPLNFVDLLFPIPSSAPFPPGFSVIVQNDDQVVTTPLVGATEDIEVVNAILASFPDEYDIELTAVIVEGRAPAFIDDVDNNGVYDANDVAGMGYTLLSNEASILLTHLNYQARAIQQDSYECPSSSTPFGSDQQLYVDLDGSGFSGACQDGDGTASSSVRRPR